MFIGEEKGLQNLNQILKEMEKRGWNLFFSKQRSSLFLHSIWLLLDISFVIPRVCITLRKKKKEQGA